MTATSGYMELIHECNVCRGRFSDEELLRTHICPVQPGNEFIELNAEPGEDRLGIINDENKE